MVAKSSLKYDKEKAIRISDSLGFIKGKITSLYILGNYYGISGDFELSVEFYYKAIQIWEAIGNKVKNS